MDDDVVILRPSRWKTVLLLLISLTFVAIAVWMFLLGESRAIAIFTGLFFGLGVIVFVVQLLPNSSWLRLDRDGFTIRSLYRDSRSSWNDMLHFHPIRIRRNSMVGWKYAEEYEQSQTGRIVANTLTGVEGALPDTYGMKPAELADLMNSYVVKYGNNDHS